MDRQEAVERVEAWRVLTPQPRRRRGLTEEHVEPLTIAFRLAHPELGELDRIREEKAVLSERRDCYNSIMARGDGQTTGGTGDTVPAAAGGKRVATSADRLGLWKSASRQGHDELPVQHVRID